MCIRDRFLFLLLFFVVIMVQLVLLPGSFFAVWSLSLRFFMPFFFETGRGSMVAAAAAAVSIVVGDIVVVVVLVIYVQYQ